MACLPIKKQIEQLGEDVIKKIQAKFRMGEIVPYEYQCVMYSEIGKRLARYIHPFFCKASVSAGKTIVFAMIAQRCKEMGYPFMLLARQAEIVSQDSKEMDNMGIANSVFCSGLNVKSVYFPIVVGSEKTVSNGMYKQLNSYAPLVLGVDECHQVDWVDLYEAIKEDLPHDIMSRPSGEVYSINGKVVEPGMAAQDAPKGMDIVFGRGRKQYTLVIMELMRRCRRVHGKELRIFGMTGSEFRGIDPILVENDDDGRPAFWREMVTNIDTNYLVEFGSVVPTRFGMVGEVKYNLDEFHASGQDGTQDFSAEDMRKMAKKVKESGDVTRKIMQMVAEEAKSRNGVLITCADRHHCQQAADALPEGSTYAIITDGMSAKSREKILEQAYYGKIKYIFQVMALTTGVNIPPWDFSVILRKIGSLTLLVQLLGRGMRQLKKEHKELGMKKDDHLVWDFAGTMDDLGELYFDPMLEESNYQRRRDKGREIKECPECNGENSATARRCMNRLDSGERCGYFFNYKECGIEKNPHTGEEQFDGKGCRAKNDVAAKFCSECGHQMSDPDKNLTGKAYTINDWCSVSDFKIEPSKNMKMILVNYKLVSAKGEEFNAVEKFFPESDNRICRIKWREFAEKHIMDKKIAKLIASYRNCQKIIASEHHFEAPVRVTHRLTVKGDHIISRREFGYENNPI